MLLVAKMVQFVSPSPSSRLTHVNSSDKNELDLILEESCSFILSTGLRKVL